jgi:exonuclease SbcD
MKIAIISDWHLGLNWGSDLEFDSFAQLSQAFEQIKSKDVDLILVAGDLFDKKDPNHEVYYEAIKLLNNVDTENKINLKNAEGMILKIPMLSIFGNHEFKGKDYKSTVELLEVIGFLKVLHATSVTIGDVNVFGLGGVPDRYAKDILNKFNPLPVPNEYNILMVHQSFKEYLPFDSEDMLSLSNLPANFNLIINGHLHWNIVVDLEQGGKFMMPGSTVSTQNKKLEADKPKGFYLLDTNTNNLVFEEIKNTRPIFYIDLKFNKVDIQTITLEIRKRLTEINNKKYNKKPMVRVRIKGDLEEGYFSKDLDLKKIELEFPELYLSFSNKIDEKRLKESLEKLKELQTKKANVEGISREIFFEQLKQTQFSNSFDSQRLFELLYNKDLEKAKDIILDKDSKI